MSAFLIVNLQAEWDRLHFVAEQRKHLVYLVEAQGFLALF